jgi:hypothetical protein
MIQFFGECICRRDFQPKQKFSIGSCILLARRYCKSPIVGDIVNQEIGYFRFHDVNYQ